MSKKRNTLTRQGLPNLDGPRNGRKSRAFEKLKRADGTPYNGPCPHVVTLYEDAHSVRCVDCGEVLQHRDEEET